MESTCPALHHYTQPTAPVIDRLTRACVVLLCCYDQPNKQTEADNVFGTDPEHPANRYLFGSSCGDTYVGGRVHGLQLPIHYDYHELRHTPRQLRAFFASQQQKGLGWDSVVAFQTRNPLHRAHFELTQRAIADGKLKLLLHPGMICVVLGAGLRRSSPPSPPATACVI